MTEDPDLLDVLDWWQAIRKAINNELNLQSLPKDK